MFRWLFRIAILLVVLAGVAGAVGYSMLAKPFRGFQGERMLEIAKGSSSRDIAKQLTEAGVIQSEWKFLAARAFNSGVVLQAGEYQFQDAATVWEVIDRLRRGDVYTFEFTIPEGSNIWDIARLVETSGLFDEKDFLAAAADPSLVKDIDPAAESLEGYLFPSTYRLSHKTTAKDLCRMMVEQFKRQWKQVGGEMAPHDAVTLASLVEEETGVSSERELVAGVFSNRLKKGMQLACDPTVMYASKLLGRSRPSVIFKADLKREHPYNTYLNVGLPPGPISSPGAASIKAALHPAATDAIYFMARPDRRGHVFSATLAAHNRAVQNFRNAVAAAKFAETANQEN